jgi:hypothetical protein
VARSGAGQGGGLHWEFKGREPVTKRDESKLRGLWSCVLKNWDKIIFITTDGTTEQKKDVATV